MSHLTEDEMILMMQIQYKSVLTDKDIAAVVELSGGAAAIIQAKKDAEALAESRRRIREDEDAENDYKLRLACALSASLQEEEKRIEKEKALQLANDAAIAAAMAGFESLRV